MVEPEHGTVGGQDDGNFESQGHLHETAADSGAGEANADGAHDARSPHRHRVSTDGETAATYARNLDENLRSLLDRLKSGTYRAPPVRCVHSPKGDGSKTRPIGLPTFEDKVLQRAVTMVLEAIYEQELLDCSYGFRPARSAHHALQALWHGLMKMHGGWVLEIDIEAFFDTLVHEHLRSFLDRRVRDGVLRPTINK